jgi:DNA-binding NarL/FixJ family response regulator
MAVTRRGAARNSDDSSRRLIRVAVVEENDIFRQGIVACLERDDAIEVVFEARAGPVTTVADVAIASEFAAAGIACARPMLVCSDGVRAADHPATRGNVVAVLPRSQLTEEQLGAAVRAAASGLRVDVPLDRTANPTNGLPERSLQILRLLAMGYGTREISDTVGCSERTVKYAIREAERCLEARSRAHVVAEAIRQGLI